MRDCIKGLQEAFGPRIERIFGAQGSLIAVIDRIDGKAEQVAIDLSQKVPVALIDMMTLSSLNRLGAASPLAQVQTYYDADQDTPSADSPSRLATMAEEKFNGARLLMDQRLHTPALDLLLAAQLATAADRAGLRHSQGCCRGRCLGLQRSDSKRNFNPGRGRPDHADRWSVPGDDCARNAYGSIDERYGCLHGAVMVSVFVPNTRVVMI
jgi:hypothetical protein